MDLLQKELARKKAALASAKSSAAAGGRFLKAGELRRRQEEEEEEERQQRAQREQPKKKQRVESEDGTPVAKKESKQSKKTKSSTTKQSEEDLGNLSTAELTQRLRAMGLPVRLFGEASNEPRLERLRSALEQQQKSMTSASEMDEFRLAKDHRTRNPFLEKDEAEKLPTEAFGSHEDKNVAKKETKEQKEEASSDPHKRIYRYFKDLLKQWEEDLVARDDAEKRSVAGRNETKTHKQCKDYIRPLFKLCKNRKLEEGMMNNLLKIIDFCEQGEFVRAHDAYMDVAIGRAAWPIGVTMVGIHARTGRSKIESQNVAHVMNSELQRKYLTSVKRLMSYAQKKRPDVDPSKKVVN